MNLNSVVLPHNEAAIWFKQLFAGFLSANVVNVPCSFQNLQELYACEDAEFVATEALDGSLAPRKVAIWIQIHRRLESEGSVRCRILDAVAHWTRNITRDVRVTVVANSDADDFANRTGFVVNSTHRLLLSIRFPSGVDVLTRTRSVDIAFGALNTTPHIEIIAAVQKTLAALAIEEPYLALPACVFAPILEVQENHSYASHYIGACREFFKLGESDPSVTVTDVARAGSTADMQPIDTPVRLCARGLGEDKTTHSSSFYGALCCLGETREEIKLYLQRETGSPMGLQNGSFWRAKNLHVVATQTSVLQLFGHVSLFAASGTPGEAIHAPNSWIWVQNTALRPVDDDLLAAYAVYVGNMRSSMPGNSMLHPAYSRCLERSSSLLRAYRECTLGTSNLDARQCNNDAKTEEGVITHSVEERYLREAFGLNFRSGRISIGDAIAHLSRAGSTSSGLAELMCGAAARLGVKASLRQVVELCVSSLRSTSLVNNTSSCTGRAMRAALDALCSPGDVFCAVRSTCTVGTSPLPLADGALRVRRALFIMGLRRAQSVNVSRQSGWPLLGGIRTFLPLTHGTTNPDILKRADTFLEESLDLRDGIWFRNVCRATARALSTALIGTAGDALPVFLLSCDSSLCIRIFLLRGAVKRSVARSTLDEMASHHKICVVVLQSCSEFSALLSSTDSSLSTLRKKRRISTTHTTPLL